MIKSKLKKILTSKALWLSLFAIGSVILTSSSAFAGTPVAADGKTAVKTSEELDEVWSKMASLMGGTGGKLLAIGIIVSAIWNRERLGIPMTAVSAVAGIMIPMTPKIVGGFSFLI